MKELEICPRCSAKFASREALVAGGVPFGFNVFTFSDVSVVVRCPDCLHLFPARKLKLFGFLSPNGIRWALLAIVFICLAILVW
jgi:hypothetical protein